MSTAISIWASTHWGASSHHERLEVVSHLPAVAVVAVSCVHLLLLIQRDLEPWGLGQAERGRRVREGGAGRGKICCVYKSMLVVLMSTP